MTIRTWTEEENYKNQCCDGIAKMLQLFCLNCYTPDDIGGCHRCAIGKANLMMLEYLNKVLLPSEELQKVLRAVRSEDRYFRFQKLKTHFRPEKASAGYRERVIAERGIPYSDDLIEGWAKEMEQCDNLINAIGAIKSNILPNKSR